MNRSFGEIKTSPFLGGWPYPPEICFCKFGRMKNQFDCHSEGSEESRGKLREGSKEILRPAAAKLKDDNFLTSGEPCLPAGSIYRELKSNDFVNFFQYTQ